MYIYLTCHNNYFSRNHNYKYLVYVLLYFNNFSDLSKYPVLLFLTYRAGKILIDKLLSITVITYNYSNIMTSQKKRKAL